MRSSAAQTGCRSPARPLNYSDAAIMAQIVGKPFEHHSDGST